MAGIHTARMTAYVNQMQAFYDHLEPECRAMNEAELKHLHAEAEMMINDKNTSVVEHQTAMAISQWVMFELGLRKANQPKRKGAKQP